MNIKSLIGLETVDSILAQFNTQQEALRTLAAKLGTRCQAKHEEGQRIIAVANDLGHERDRAIRVAERIANLVG